MPDPAVLLDRAGRVIHLNAAAAQLAPALRALGHEVAESLDLWGGSVNKGQ